MQTYCAHLAHHKQVLTQKVSMLLGRLLVHRDSTLNGQLLPTCDRVPATCVGTGSPFSQVKDDGCQPARWTTWPQLPVCLRAGFLLLQGSCPTSFHHKVLCIPRRTALAGLTGVQLPPQVVSIQVYLAREGYIDNSLAFFSYGGDILLAVLTYLLWRAEGKP